MQYKQCGLPLIKIYTTYNKREEEILSVSSDESGVINTPIFFQLLK